MIGAVVGIEFIFVATYQVFGLSVSVPRTKCPNELQSDPEFFARSACCADLNIDTEQSQCCVSFI